MKTARKKFIIISLIYIAGIITGVCAGFYITHKKITAFKEMSGHKRHDFFMRHIMKHLDLTEEQRVKIQEKFKEMHMPFDKKKEQIGREYQKQQELMKAESFDEEAYRESYRRISALKEDIYISHAHVKRDIRTLLTDEQRTKLNELFSKMKGQFGMMGKGHGRGMKRKHEHGTDHCKEHCLQK